jgi:HSP20 family molecular chaperone IbpA
LELPYTIDAEAISALAKEGVLTVHVPKTRVEVKKLARIEVQ